MRTLLAASLLFLAGCAAQRELQPFQPASSQSAVIQWQRSGHSLTCEAVCARSADGAALMRLYKQSPSPLLELRLEKDGLLSAKGSLTGGRSWTGKYGDAPAPLATWISFLSIYQRAQELPDGDKELHTSASRVAYQKSKAGLKTLSVANTDSAESVTGYFQSGN